MVTQGLRGKVGVRLLSPSQAWPSATLSYEERYEVMVAFCQFAAQAFVEVKEPGHPMEIGHAFLDGRLPAVLAAFNQNFTRTHAVSRGTDCYECLDIAVHDAYGNLHQIDIYDTYSSEYMTRSQLLFWFKSGGDRFKECSE